MMKVDMGVDNVVGVVALREASPSKSLYAHDGCNDWRRFSGIVKPLVDLAQPSRARLALSVLGTTRLESHSLKSRVIKHFLLFAEQQFFEHILVV